MRKRAPVEIERRSGAQSRGNLFPDGEQKRTICAIFFPSLHLCPSLLPCSICDHVERYYRHYHLFYCMAHPLCRCCSAELCARWQSCSTLIPVLPTRTRVCASLSRVIRGRTRGASPCQTLQDSRAHKGRRRDDVRAGGANEEACAIGSARPQGSPSSR